MNIVYFQTSKRRKRGQSNKRLSGEGYRVEFTQRELVVLKFFGCNWRLSSQSGQTRRW